MEPSTTLVPANASSVRRRRPRRVATATADPERDRDRHRQQERQPGQLRGRGQPLGDRLPTGSWRHDRGAQVTGEAGPGGSAGTARARGRRGRARPASPRRGSAGAVGPSAARTGSPGMRWIIRNDSGDHAPTATPTAVPVAGSRTGSTVHRAARAASGSGRPLASRSCGCFPSLRWRFGVDVSSASGCWSARARLRW